MSSTADTMPTTDSGLPELRWYPTVAVILAASAGTDLACVQRTGREPGHELCADDEVLHGGSAGNGNVHGVTSLIEVDPQTGRRVPVLRLKPGKRHEVDLGGWHIPAVYQRTLTCGPDQVSHGVALGLPRDPRKVGVIFHFGGLKLTPAECEEELTEMVAGGMARRGVTDYDLRLDVATSLQHPDYPNMWRGAGAMLLFLSRPFRDKYGESVEPLP